MEEYGCACPVGNSLLVGPPGRCIHGVTQIEYYCSVVRSSAIIVVTYALHNALHMRTLLGWVLVFIELLHL